MDSEHSSAAPSLDKIESLLGLLELNDKFNENSMMANMPSLRMTSPTPGGRVSGGVVSFKGEVHLGPIVTAKLVANRNTPSSRSEKGLTTDSPRFDDDTYRSTMGSSGCSGDGSFCRIKEMLLPLPDIARCVVHVIVDDVVASTIPIDSAAAPAVQNDGSEDGFVVAINTVLVPAYENRKLCSKHPATASTAAAAGGGDWANDEVAWHLQTRAIDKICTREMFGAHRIYGELACRSSLMDGDDIEKDSS